MLLFKTYGAIIRATRGTIAPCKEKGGTALENQCVIRLSIALKDSGMNLLSYTGVKCWLGHKNHILGVEEMIPWFKGRKSRRRRLDQVQARD